MSEDYAYQISVKFGEHDTSMANVRANSEEEMNARLAYVNQNAGNIVVAAETLRRTAMEGQPVATNPSPPVANPVPQTVPQQPPGGAQPAQAQPTPGHPSCAHGPMTFKQGISKKNGQPWSAYMCPAPQGQPQCAPQFL